jgi:acetyl esterase/lipase
MKSTFLGSLFFVHIVAASGSVPAGSFSTSDKKHYGASLQEVMIDGEVASVLVPSEPASGRPWLLATQLYDMDVPDFAALAQTQLDFVKRGFHVVALPLGGSLAEDDSGKFWTDAYRLVTTSYGLSKEAALMAVGSEGPGVVRWATENPGKVSCLYLEKAVGDIKRWRDKKLTPDSKDPELWGQIQQSYGFTSPEEALSYNLNPVDLAPKLAEQRVSIIYVAGTADTEVPFAIHGRPLQELYAKKSLFFRLINNPKQAHRPYGARKTADVVRFVEMNTYPVEPTAQVVSYGPHSSQVLDFWKAEAEGPTPVVIYFHGGGWRQGTRRNLPNLEEYLANGISAVAVGYRFTDQAAAEGIEPPVQGPMMDAARAVQFVRSKAAEWNLDSGRIALLGASAGSCSALWLAFSPDQADPTAEDPVSRESTRPFCAAVVQPQTSLDPAQMKEWIPNITYGSHAFGLSNFDEFLAKRESILPWITTYSPYGLADKTAPPVYLHYSEPPAVGSFQKDATHSANFGVKLKERLDELGVPCELFHPEAINVPHARPSHWIIHQLQRPKA